MIKKIFNKVQGLLIIITDKNYRVDWKIRHGYYDKMPDDSFLQMIYKLKFGRELNLVNPTRLTEKIQWLKINNRNGLFTTLVDKYLCKDYVARIIGSEFVLPTLGVWENPEAIDFELLPQKFVLKCNHDSGSVIVCRDKTKLDINKTVRSLSKSLKHNHFNGGREYPYKNVKPMIIAEQLLENSDSSQLLEYNVFCFNGSPEFVSVCHGDRDKGEKRYNDMYSIEGQKLDFEWGYESSNKIMDLNNRFFEAVDKAQLLCASIPFVRIDFYECNGHLFFSEFTFFHWSGMKNFTPEKWDLIYGSKLKLN